MLFEKQEYQETCVDNILRVFEHADGYDNPDALKAGLRQLHSEQNIPDRSLRDDLRLDVLMETGTGKTFTYLKTMYEMNRQYGLNKFLIFVPRLAIRAGIIQNIDLTYDYFSQEYGKRIKKYTYGDKNGLSQVESYISNKGEFSVLILTGASITSKTNGDKILARQNEKDLFDSEVPLTKISQLKPVVFIDEPHLLKAKGFTNAYNKYFFDSLLLRFGATFPQEENSKLSNVVYTLDSLTAFRNHLVKGISVSTITDNKSTIKFYRSGKKNAPLTLHYFKDGIERKADVEHGQNISTITGDKNHNFHSLRIKQDTIILSNGEQQDLSSENYVLSEDTIRYMVRETIKIHFEKEKYLFDRKIKTLSLFFIPRVSDFRGDNPRVKKIFEEEYEKQRDDKLKEVLSNPYREYLKRDYNDEKELCVHQGYFSGDKGSNEDERNSRGIKVILNDKERLLSTEEPLRFIFSVWALQEGWDNPNIFTICKLASTKVKEASKTVKETTRRQQVGRGLRLAVDNHGRRQTIKHCQDSESGFYSINTLDVVVSGQEKNFIEGIQSEIIGGSLTSNQLSRAALLELGLNGSQANHLTVFLEAHSIITIDESATDTWAIHSSIADFLKKNKDILPETLAEKYETLVEAFRKSPHFSITNRNKKSDMVGIRNEKFQEFENLWHTITNKAEIVYRSIDDDKLIADVKKYFNKEAVPAIKRKIEKRTYDHKNNQIVFEKEESLGEIETFSANRYSRFITDFAEREILPLRFCLKLFNALDRKKIANNPKRAYELISKGIKDAIHKNVIESVDYEFKGEITINGKSAINETRKIFYEDDKFKKPRKEIEASHLGDYHISDPPQANYLYDKIVYDSNIERDVVKNDPERVDENKIVVFAKLPKISIPTPYKSYSPDFAYYIQGESGKKLFLVVETKGYNREGDIPDDEMKKIEYAKRFFLALKMQTTEADIVYKKRINKQELSDLLHEIGAGT
ncbi:MAG: DEAD/DEAH box helicase family protein [Pseudohongiellaceae bacterium]